MIGHWICVAVPVHPSCDLGCGFWPAIYNRCRHKHREIDWVSDPCGCWIGSLYPEHSVFLPPLPMLSLGALKFGFFFLDCHCPGGVCGQRGSRSTGHFSCYIFPTYWKFSGSRVSLFYPRLFNFAETQQVLALVCQERCFRASLDRNSMH